MYKLKQEDMSVLCIACVHMLGEWLEMSQDVLKCETLLGVLSVRIFELDLGCLGLVVHYLVNPVRAGVCTHMQCVAQHAGHSML